MLHQMNRLHKTEKYMVRCESCGKPSNIFQGGIVASKPDLSFTPYSSPLQYFRSYRFHPQFKDAVEGGLKSLTYSSKIDPKLAMCPDELDGRECPKGPSCEFQHYSSMIAKGEPDRPQLNC